MIEKSLSDAAELATTLKAPAFVNEVTEAGKILVECFKAGNKVLVCGNGGSLCDAQHFAEEFTGKYKRARKPLPVIALADSAFLSCVANDFGWDRAFVRGVQAFGKPGDVLVCLSTSGESENVIEAFLAAERGYLHTITLLGKGGGGLAGLGDACLIVPSEATERIQEAHMLILHILVEYVEREMFPENYKDSK